MDTEGGGDSGLGGKLQKKKMVEHVGKTVRDCKRQVVLGKNDTVPS